MAAEKKFPVLVAKSVRLGSLFCFVTLWYGVGLFIPFGEKGLKKKNGKCLFLPLLPSSAITIVSNRSRALCRDNNQRIEQAMACNIYTTQLGLIQKYPLEYIKRKHALKVEKSVTYVVKE